jgi:two-component system, LytTR family, sensor kinase
MEPDTKRWFNHKAVIILLHIAAWAVFIFFPFLFFRVRILDKSFYYTQLIDSAFLATFFYLNTYYFIPKLFSQKRILRYLLVIVGIIVVIAAQQFTVEWFFIRRNASDLDFGKKSVQIQIDSPFKSEADFKEGPEKYDPSFKNNFPPYDSLRKMPPPPYEFRSPFRIIHIPGIFLRSLSSALFILLLSGFIKIAQEWFKTEKKRKELENQRLNAELAFLKSQVNPHFFFNTLNSIYALAHKKSDRTEEAILKLSEIMRYMIYESEVEVVSLTREVEYINHYIDLQKLRLSKNIDVQLNVSGETSGHTISPMLLIPFIENAFKHGISYTHKSYVHIQLIVNRNIIEFNITNSRHNKAKSNDNDSGLGLENVTKRLNLLYAQKHSLHISESEKEYIVNLKIELGHG